MPNDDNSSMLFRDTPSSSRASSRATSRTNSPMKRRTPGKGSAVSAIEPDDVVEDAPLQVIFILNLDYDNS